MAKKNDSPAPDSKKAAERQAKLEARKAARKTILDFIAENPDLPIKDELSLFIKQPGTRGRKSNGLFEKVRAEFLASEGGITEFALFKKFKIGRGEMRSISKKMLVCDDPSDRVWVTLDEKAEKYVVAGTGATAPDGWAGYIPADKETL